MRSRAYWNTVTGNQSLEPQDSLLSSQLACLLQKIPFCRKSSQPLHCRTREGHSKMGVKTLRMIAKRRQGRCAVPHPYCQSFVHTHTHSQIITGCLYDCLMGCREAPHFQKENWTGCIPSPANPPNF